MGVFMYLSDVSDGEWEIRVGLIPPAKAFGLALASNISGGWQRSASAKNASALSKWCGLPHPGSVPTSFHPRAMASPMPAFIPKPPAGQVR